MGLIDRFLNGVRLNDNGEESYDDGDFYDEEEVEIEKTPVRKTSTNKIDKFDKKESLLDSEDHLPKKVVSSPKVTNIRQARKITPNGMDVYVSKPTNLEEARAITDMLLDNQTVVLNLEGLKWDIAQRILDFTSGSCYAISGNLQKISNCIFIITPESVRISGGVQGLLEEFEAPFNGMR